MKIYPFNSKLEGVLVDKSVGMDPIDVKIPPTCNGNKSLARMRKAEAHMQSNIQAISNVKTDPEKAFNSDEAIEWASRISFKPGSRISYRPKNRSERGICLGKKNEFQGTIR